MEFLEQLKSHDEAIIVLLTLILALANIIYIYQNSQLLRENKLLRQATNTPKLIAYLEPNPRHNSAVDFCLENIGTGPALDIVITTKSDISYLKEKNILIHDGKIPFDGTPFISSGNTLRHFIGMGHKIFDSNPLQPFIINIGFSSLSGKKYQQTSFMDISHHRGIIQVGGDASEVQITNELKKISKSLEKLSQK